MTNQRLSSCISDAIVVIIYYFKKRKRLVHQGILVLQSAIFINIKIKQFLYRMAVLTKSKHCITGDLKIVNRLLSWSLWIKLRSDHKCTHHMIEDSTILIKQIEYVWGSACRKSEIDKSLELSPHVKTTNKSYVHNKLICNVATEGMNSLSEDLFPAFLTQVFEHFTPSDTLLTVQR